MTKLAKRGPVASEALAALKNVLLAEYTYYYSQQRTYKSLLLHKQCIDWGFAARRCGGAKLIHSTGEIRHGRQTLHFVAEAA